MNKLTAVLIFLNSLYDNIKTLPFVLAIFLTLSLNLFLIGQIVKRKHFYQSPKYTVILSMAVADILQAELPFVIACKKTLLSEGDELTGLEQWIGKFYINYFVHFVYGWSLVLLGVELVCRPRFEGLKRKCLLACITSCIPWAAGGLPVWTLVATDQSYGYFTSQRSLVLASVLCVFQPAILNLFICAGIYVTHFWANDKDYLPMPDSSYLAVLRDISEVITSRFGLKNVKNVPTYHHTVEVDSSGANYLTAQSSICPAHAQSLETASQKQDNKLSNVSTAEHFCHSTDIHRDVAHMIKQSVRKEIYQLMSLSLVFIITVIPFHVFSLVEDADRESLHYRLTIDTLRWIMFARSFITPFIMMRFSSQYKFMCAPSYEMIITILL